MEFPGKILQLDNQKIESYFKRQKFKDKIEKKINRIRFDNL